MTRSSRIAGPANQAFSGNGATGIAVDRDHRAFRALDAELHDAGAVEIEDAQPHIRGRRHVDLRVGRAVGAADGAEGAALSPLHRS